MEGKRLKAARELLPAVKSLTMERQGWDYLFNEGDVIAMKKPDAQNHPIIRSQGYVAKSPQEIIDFLRNPSNTQKWNTMSKSTLEEDVIGKSGNVTYKKVIYGFREGPEDLDREVEYYSCLLKEEDGLYLVGYTEGEDPSTSGKLKSFFMHFTFVITAIPPIPVAGALFASRVTFLWQSKTEGSYRPENIARIMKSMGEYVRNIKVALERPSA